MGREWTGCRELREQVGHALTPRQEGTMGDMESMRRMGAMGLVSIDKSIIADLQNSITEPTFVIGELVKGEHKVILA